jgi:hypothetical protein
LGQKNLSAVKLLLDDVKAGSVEFAAAVRAELISFGKNANALGLTSL